MVTFSNTHTADVEIPGVPETPHARGYMLQPGASIDIEDDVAARMLENPGLRIYVAGRMIAVEGMEAPPPERKPGGSPVVIGAAPPVVVAAPESDDEGEEKPIPSSRPKPRSGRRR